MVVVATDTSRHVPDTLEALDAGARLVLVEKPVAPTADDATRLAQHPLGSRVRVCAPLRFHHGLEALRRALPSLGCPLAARVESQSWLPDWRPDRDFRESYSARPTEGGVLRDLVHEIDYAAWVLGRPVEIQGLVAGSQARRSPVLGLPVDESADLQWSTAAGHTVSLRLDYVTRPTRRRITLTGAQGSLEWDVLCATLTRTSVEGATWVERFEDDLDRDVVMARQARAALRLLDGPAASVLPTLDEGIEAVTVGDIARRYTEVGMRQQGMHL